jgi:hypothetical protein
VTAPVVVECAACHGPIRSLADAVEHADCHRAGELDNEPRCGETRPLLRLAGVDLPLIPCVRPVDHVDRPHRGADGSEWTVVVPEWWELVERDFADVLAALIRRTGGDRVELAADEIAKRGPDEVVRYEFDDDRGVLVEIIREMQA